MSDEPIDFAAAKERREDAKTDAEIDAEEAHWNRVSERLFDVMATSGLSDIGLTSATLRALLDVLTGDGAELADAKQNIIRATKAFFDRSKWRT